MQGNYITINPHNSEVLQNLRYKVDCVSHALNFLLIFQPAPTNVAFALLTLQPAQLSVYLETVRLAMP